MQVQELLQHRTGSNALAQQSDAGRNAVEVMGLQKVYPAKKGRSVRLSLLCCLYKKTPVLAQLSWHLKC